MIRRLSILAAATAFSANVSAQEPPATPVPVPQQPAAQSPAAPGDQPSPSAQPNVADQNADVLSAIANLSPMIGDVQIVGPWAEGDRNGVWRTIMTQSVGETKGNRFFYQQVEERDGKAVVVNSTEVTEIQTVQGAIVGYRADAPAEGQESNLTLFFDIVPLDGEITETYELFVAPGQPYRFGPASN